MNKRSFVTILMIIVTVRLNNICTVRTVSILFLFFVSTFSFLSPSLSPPPPPPHSSSQSFLKPSPVMFEEDVKPTLEYRRKTITPRPNARINLWTIMKNCIGKELTKIPMPVSKRERERERERENEESCTFNNNSTCFCFTFTNVNTLLGSFW